MIQTGECHGYHWLVTPAQIRQLTDLAAHFHSGLRLCITAFDSGVIRPDDHELAIGWSVQGEVMVSPPLAEDIDIPHHEWDEWYVVSSPAFDTRPSLEVFVNYGGFTVVPPEVTYKTLDPTWDRHGLDFLLPIQQRFWAQLAEINPVTYVATGDNDVVVTRNISFIEEIRRRLQNST